jgi:hypothetical protein
MNLAGRAFTCINLRVQPLYGSNLLPGWLSYLRTGYRDSLSNESHTLELFNHKRQSGELVKQRGLGGFPHERLLNPEGATHSPGVVTQITATRFTEWSGQYGLLDFSYKPSPFRSGLLTAAQSPIIAVYNQI